jgi:hypothetical protein
MQGKDVRDLSTDPLRPEHVPWTSECSFCSRYSVIWGPKYDGCSRIVCVRCFCDTRMDEEKMASGQHVAIERARWHGRD